MAEVLGSKNEASVDPAQKLQVLHADPVSVKNALLKEKLLAHPSPTFLLISSAKCAIGFFDGSLEGLFDDTVEGGSEGIDIPWIEGAMLGRRDGSFDVTMLASQFPNVIVCSSPMSALKGSCSNF